MGATESVIIALTHADIAASPVMTAAAWGITGVAHNRKAKQIGREAYWTSPAELRAHQASLKHKPKLVRFTS